MEICLEKNYPKHLVSALELIHKLDASHAVNIIHDKDLTEKDAPKTIVFLFDRSKRSLDITTEKYFEMGFRIFAFKIATADKLNLFELSLTVLTLWKKVIQIIRNENTPFIYTFGYARARLNRVK